MHRCIPAHSLHTNKHTRTPTRIIKQEHPLHDNMSRTKCAQKLNNATAQPQLPANKATTSRRPVTNSSGPKRLHVALVLAFVVFRQWLNVLVHSPVRSCADTQPLVATYPDVLSDEDFHRLRNAVMSTLGLDDNDKAPTTRTNTLNDGNFGSTRGYVLSFNRDGLHKLQRSVYNVDDALMSYFRLASLPHANAFVLNVLVCDDQQVANVRSGTTNEGGNEASNLPTSSSTAAVGLHVDNTLAIDSMYEFYAHHVSVLYLQVPNDMLGGDLELYFGNNTGAPTEGKAEANSAPPDASVTPAEGLLVGFRGDALHGVQSFTSKSKQPRVSLVLESYMIPESEYNNTAEYVEDLKGFPRTFDRLLQLHAATTYVMWFGLTACVGILVQDKFGAK